MVRRVRALNLLAALALASCGGGGGSSSPSPSPPANLPPVVSNASISLTVEEDQPVSFDLSATDPGGDSLAASVATAPQKGQVSISGTNPFSITYTPLANENGSDSFQVSVTDGRGGAASTAVSVTITPVDDYPTMDAASFSMAEDGVLSGQVQAQDIDSDVLTYEIVGQPLLGAVILDANTGAFTYTPAPDVNGTDQFLVWASAGELAAAATVSVTIEPGNDAPIAAEDHALVPSGGPYLVPVLVNDTDIDGDTLSVSIASSTPGVTATVVNGGIEVTPLAGMRGPTGLTYRVTDPAGASSTANVSIVVDGASEFFYLAATGPGGEPEIWRQERFLTRKARAPIPVGHKLVRFTTSEDGGMLAYATVQEGTTGPHSLWVQDQYDEAQPVRQVATPPNYQAVSISLNSLGTLLIFDDQIVGTADPSAPQPIEAGVTVMRPVFQPHTTIYYTAVLPDTSLVIKRAKVADDGTPFDREPMTAAYGPAEGPGTDFRQTPNYARIVSIGRVMTDPMLGLGLKQHAFVTWADGSRMDTKLHPDLTHVNDMAMLPWVTADSTHAVYYASLGGVEGLYSTDLGNPGLAVRMMAMAPAEADVILHGDSSAVFTKGLGWPNWLRATVGVAETSVPFLPSPSTPATAPRELAVAPDGHAVVFDVADGIYATLQGQFDSGTLLHTRPAGTFQPQLTYAPDSSAVVVVEAEAAGSGRVNPRAPGWFAPLDPAPVLPAAPSTACIAFAGQGC